MQVRQQVAEGLASTRCGVSGIRSSLLHSPDMLKKGLQLLLVVLRLSTAACEAAIGSSFPQVRCQQSTLCWHLTITAPCAVMLPGSHTLQLSQAHFLCPDADSRLVHSWSCTNPLWYCSCMAGTSRYICSTEHQTYASTLLCKCLFRC